MEESKKRKLNGSCLIAAQEGVSDLQETMRRFKAQTKVKLDFLFMPVSQNGYGMSEIEAKDCGISLHNLRRSIESIEMYFDIMEMLINNMQSDLNSIAIVQRISSERGAYLRAQERVEEQREAKRERDREAIAKKRSADKAATETE